MDDSVQTPSKELLHLEANGWKMKNVDGEYQFRKEGAFMSGHCTYEDALKFQDMLDNWAKKA